MALSEDQGSSRTTFHARSAIVNRTHRVVRERAAVIKAQRQRERNLLLPVLICCGLLFFIAYAVFSVVDDRGSWEGSLLRRVHDLTTDAGGTASILLIWFLPLTFIVAAIVLFRRSRGSSRDSGEAGR